MGERTSYVPGTFSWVDLGTTDAEAAKGFYSALFGWEAEDMPAGEDATYTMARIGGKWVAALYGLSAEQRERGQHPAWLSYVTVDDADAAAGTARELGGTVVSDAFDVLDSGRMALFRDPQGAFFAVWQPRQHIGAQRVNEPGTLTWNELATTDVDAAKQFYAGLFGWGSQQLDTGGGPPYVIVDVAGRTNGSITTLRQEGVPPHWLVYFVSADVDASAARIGELGGRVMVPPMDIPNGSRIAVAADPQGAVFALFQGEVDD
jgi:predicted enzyme related to lactoylglutathione lyase